MAYPPKPQPNQQQGQQDPLLSGLMSQPSQPSQPAQGGQTGNWGGGNDWWKGGQSANLTAPPNPPTAGYGDYSPNPNAGGVPPPVTPPVTPPAPDVQNPPAVDPRAQQQIANLNRQIQQKQQAIRQLQLQMQQYINDIGNFPNNPRMQQAMKSKANTAKVQLMHLQQDMQQLQQQLAGLQGG